jgi:hypothetical protein
VQSLENKLDDLRLRLSYQQDIKNCNILCFTETWLNDDTGNIELAGFSVFRQDRTATSGKTRGGGVCLFANNCWCAMSNIKEVSRYCSPEVEYLMISCRPHYLPTEFSSILFVAVHKPILALRPHSTSCIRPEANKKMLIQKRRSLCPGTLM